MAAALRGGAVRPAKPRAKKAAPAQVRKAASKGPSKSGKQPAYVPAKLGAVRNIDLPPQFAAAVIGVLAVLGLAAGLVPDHHAEKLIAAMGAGLDNQLAKAGLRVKALTIQGASAMAEPDIVRAAGVYKDQPLVGVDLAAIRRNVEQVGWVKSARVVRLFPDTIVIAVTQRQTLAVWQHAGHTLVVDSDGQPIPEADPGRFADLPLIVGDGANEAVPAILPVLSKHPTVMQRVEALVRVDNRRWDLRMRDGGLVQLPAIGEDSALIQLETLDQKSRILELGFERIDLRDPEMVAVRPREETAARPAQPAGA
jgi:cell division protein FtsQ